MKVDVIIMGAGIAGLTLATSLGRQGLKVCVIAPDILNSNSSFDFIFENEVLIDLPSNPSFSSFGVRSKATLKIFNEAIVGVDSKQLYQKTLKSCEDNGVAFMHGLVQNFVAYRKIVRVDWLPNEVEGGQLPLEEYFAPCVVDATGVESDFTKCSIENFQGRYCAIFESDKSTWNLSETDLLFFDAPLGGHEDRTYFRKSKLDNKKILYEEISLFSPLSKAVLKARLFSRFELLQADKMTVTDEKYRVVSTGGLPEFETSIFAFGDAAMMAHPIMGHSLSRIINVVPHLAKTILETINMTPREISKEAWGVIWTEDERKYDASFLGFCGLKERDDLLAIKLSALERGKDILGDEFWCIRNP